MSGKRELGKGVSYCRGECRDRSRQGKSRGEQVNKSLRREGERYMGRQVGLIRQSQVKMRQGFRAKDIRGNGSSTEHGSKTQVNQVAISRNPEPQSKSKHGDNIQVNEYSQPKRVRGPVRKEHWNVA